MFRTVSTLVRISALLSLFVFAADGQCLDVGTGWYRVLDIGREGGNAITGYPAAFVDGPYWWQWDINLTARQWISGGATFRPQQSTGWIAYYASFSWSDTLSSLGPGTFNQSSSAQYRCVASPYYTNSRPEASGSVTIQRPSVTGTDGIWYLGRPGLSDPTNGFYNAAALTGNKNCDSCTSSLTWDVSPAGALTFSPSSGNSTDAFAQTSSSSCTKDIIVRAKIDGFPSDPFKMIINRPNFTTKIGVSHGGCGRPGTTCPATNGFSSLVELYMFDLCGYLIPSIAVNETFGSFTPDTANNWSAPTPRSTAYYVTSFIDEIAAYGPLTPVPYAPLGPLSTQKINWANQTFYAGTTTSGDGQQVNTVPRHQKYIDHGNHEP